MVPENPIISFDLSLPSSGQLLSVLGLRLNVQLLIQRARAETNATHRLLGWSGDSHVTKQEGNFNPVSQVQSFNITSFITLNTSRTTFSMRLYHHQLLVWDANVAMGTGVQAGA